MAAEENYPAFITPGQQPFDPLELARRTERIVCEGKARKYTDFYCVGVYRGISTGYAVGCNLRCAFCWVGWSRDFPFKAGKLYQPRQAAERLIGNARRRGIGKARISGGEPALCPDHLLSLLDLVQGSGLLFILETNGILLGSDPGYVDSLKRSGNIHVRVSLKAGTPQGFQKKTGAGAEFFNLPFKAVERLLHSGIPFHVAAMTDPRLMPEGERAALLSTLRSIGYRDYLEEERCDPYGTSVQRLSKAGYTVY